MTVLALPHWLILAGAVSVIAGCIGIAIGRKRPAEVDDNPISEASAAPRPQMPPLPRLLDSRPKAAPPPTDRRQDTLEPAPPKPNP